MCWISASQALLPGHFWSQNRTWFRSLVIFSNTFHWFHILLFYMFIGGMCRCISRCVYACSGACLAVRPLVFIIFITRVSEVIMFSPCVFVTLFVCLCLYHDVCPDDLTMKDWCHTNNIFQVHCWGCLVGQVMFHVLVTSTMTSPGHKVG